MGTRGEQRSGEGLAGGSRRLKVAEGPHARPWPRTHAICARTRLPGALQHGRVHTEWRG